MKPRKLLADSRYSAASLRQTALEHGTLPVIPYPKNQCKGVKGILRVDRRFRSHGPQKFKSAYKKRAATERVFSRLKNWPASLITVSEDWPKSRFILNSALSSCFSPLKQPSTPTTKQKPEASDTLRTNFGTAMRAT